LLDKLKGKEIKKYRSTATTSLTNEYGNSVGKSSWNIEKYIWKLVRDSRQGSHLKEGRAIIKKELN